LVQNGRSGEPDPVPQTLETLTADLETACRASDTALADLVVALGVDAGAVLAMAALTQWPGAPEPDVLNSIIRYEAVGNQERDAAKRLRAYEAEHAFDADSPVEPLK
jgi:hypothetical protein